MSAAANLIQRLRAQRDSWLVLRPAGDGQAELAVCLRRPAEVEMRSLVSGERATLSSRVQVAVCAAAVDWRGFTEADLLGAAIGSSDPLAFDAAVWAEVVGDNAEWMTLCGNHLLDAVTRHLDERAETRKN